MAVLSDVTIWQNLVQCQPPYGSRLASGFLVGTDAIIVFPVTRVGNKIDVTTNYDHITILATYVFRWASFLALSSPRISCAFSRRPSVSTFIILQAAFPLIFISISTAILSVSFRISHFSMLQQPHTHCIILKSVVTICHSSCDDESS